MVFAFFGYLIYSNVAGVGIDLPGAAIIRELDPPISGFSPTVDQVPIVQTTMAEEDASVAPSAFLGVEVTSVDSVIAEQLGIRDGHGVLINSVLPNSPAQKAGLQRGDVIAVLNTSATKDIDTFKEVVATLSPGDTVRITYVRDGKKSRVYVELAEAPAILKTAQTTDSDDSDWGASLSSLTSALRQLFNVPSDIAGIVVLSVVPGGAADRAALMPGDVIMGIDKTPISNLDDFFSALWSDKDNTALLDIYSMGDLRYAPIKSLIMETDDEVCAADPISVEDLDSFTTLFQLVPLVGVAGLVFALLGYFSLYKYSPGDAKMRAA